MTTSPQTAEHYTWGDGCDGWHLLRSHELSVIQERMPPGASEVAHFHSKSRQFFYVLSGALSISLTDAVHVIGPEQGLEVPPTAPHRVFNDSASEVRFLVISTPPSHGDRVLVNQVALMRYHLAQVNIARMRGTTAAPVMRGLADRIDEINRLAETSPGSVWRYTGSESSHQPFQVFSDYFVPYEPERLFFNMSVWESIEQLKHYLHHTAHVEMLRDKDQWMAHFDRAYLALWWVPAGHVPTVAEARERLQRVEECGATPFAFTLTKIFPQPVATLTSAFTGQVRRELVE
jgi:mannose-6-phosphate isomerase-like protein (cupin superfamily)